MYTSLRKKQQPGEDDEGFDAAAFQQFQKQMMMDNEDHAMIPGSSAEKEYMNMMVAQQMHRR